MTNYRSLTHRINYLPKQLERARRLYRDLIAEAKRYGMTDILTDEERNR